MKITAPLNLGEECDSFGYDAEYLEAAQASGFIRSVSPGDHESYEGTEGTLARVWCPGAAQVQLSLRSAEAPSYEDGQVLATLPITIGG